MYGMSFRKIFLGLDCSTQSLSALFIDLTTHTVVFEDSLNFERELPHYKTHKGFLPSLDPENPLVVHAPPLLWVEALDVLFEKMLKKGAPLSEVLCIGGSAQQHGSVYLNETANKTLSRLNPDLPLTKQLEAIFSRETAPIWMDSSTSTECKEIREAMGGAKEVILATGSTTFERFTGPQIRKFYKTEEESYEQTEHIALISSFMASLLIGEVAPIDFGDGSGMNLMDIRTNSWHKKALEATAPHLLEKLPPLVDPSQIIGPIHPYFVKRYSFSPKTQILAWSGDNPNSLIGLGLVSEGLMGLSLGTSFTYFGHVKKCHLDLSGEGHLFAAPNGGYMPLLCFHNGALAIESMRHLYSLNWEEFQNALKETPPGNKGAILLPYFTSEIVPLIQKPNLYRFDLDSEDKEANCRALIEAQMLSIKVHSFWMKSSPTLLYATGGVSIYPSILQIAADVFNCPVVQLSVSKSSALGAALRAAFSYAREHGEAISWEGLTKNFLVSLTKAKIMPHAGAHEIYKKMQKKYALCEESVRNML